MNIFFLLFTAFFSACRSHRISPLKIWGHCTAAARKAQRKSGAAAHRIRRLYPYPLTAPAVMPAIMTRRPARNKARCD